MHIPKIYNNKKSLINSIYYLTKCHLHNILFFKKFNNRNGQKHDPINDTSRKFHSHEIMSSFFQYAFFLLLLLIFYAIYDGKFFLSSTNATKIYINLEIPKVAEIIDKCIFLKFIISKKF